MNINRKQATKMIAFTIVFGMLFYSCKTDIAEQGIYMYDAQVTADDILLVSASQETSKSIIAAASSLVTTDVTVNFTVDQTAFETYNKIAGTAYKPLPDSYYSLSGNSSVIKSGTNTSEPILLIIKPISKDAEGIEKGVEYAVAVSISSVSGDNSVLEASKTLFVVIQTASFTNVDAANTKADGILVNGPTGGWSITTNTESKPDYPTGALIDGKDTSPRFPTKEDQGFPQIFILDKKMVKSVNGFMFTPVYDYGAEAHNVYDMEIHSSNNGISWKSQGIWNNSRIDPSSSKTNPDFKYLKFLVPVKARFFKFIITRGGSTEASLAEIYSLE